MMNYKVFEENFQNYNVGSNGQPTWTPTTGNWIIEAGKVYAQRDTTLGGATGNARITLSNAKIKNGSVETTLKIDNKGSFAGLAFRAKDGYNMYMLYTNYQTVDGILALNLVKHINNAWSMIKGNIPVGGNRGDSVKLKVEFSGTEMKVYVNNIFVADATDSSFLNAGYVGLVTYEGTTAVFSYVLAERPTAPIIAGAGIGFVASVVVAYLVTKNIIKAIAIGAGGAVVGTAIAYIIA